MSRNFGKTAMFYFWTKAMLLFNPFTREYFDNLALKKTNMATLNSCISKDTANSESKLAFSRSSFNFL